jgi:hypothetical protein
MVNTWAIGDQRVEFILVKHAAAQESVSEPFDGGPMLPDQLSRLLPGLFAQALSFGPLSRTRLNLDRLGCARHRPIFEQHELDREHIRVFQIAHLTMGRSCFPLDAIGRTCVPIEQRGWTVSVLSQRAS